MKDYYYLYKKYKYLYKTKTQGGMLQLDNSDDRWKMLQHFFGKEGVQPRLDFLQTAHNHKVPIFIITSGGANDVIRTLELCGIDSFFAGVYQQSDRTMSHYLDGKVITPRHIGDSKYDLIVKILHKMGKTCGQDDFRGYFLDDTPKWGQDNYKCPNIEFVYVDSSKVAPLTANEGIGSEMEEWSQKNLGERSYQATGVSIDILERLSDEIRGGKCNVVFTDWDKCFQVLDAPYPLEYPHRESFGYAEPKKNYEIPKEHLKRQMVGDLSSKINDDNKPSPLYTGEEHPPSIDKWLTYFSDA